MAMPASNMNMMNKMKPKQTTMVNDNVAPPKKVSKQAATTMDKAACAQEGLKQTARVNNKLSTPKEGIQGLKEVLFRNQFKKTQLCHYHAGGKCKTGRACPFAHGASELNIAPDLVKTSVCPLWMAGQCNKSAKECKFAHGSEDLRMTPLFEVCLPGNRMQTNSAALGTPCIQEVDKPPMHQNSKTNSLPMPDIASRSTTCSGSDQIDSPPTSGAAQSENRCEAQTPPEAPLAKAMWVMPPAQQWLMGMKLFYAFAPKHQRDAIVVMLQNAAPEQYYD